MHDGGVPILASDALARLLDASDSPVARQCAEAIRDGGKVNIWESWSVSASHLYRVYRERAKLARSRKLDVKGIDQAVLSFKNASGDTRVGFAFVHGNRQQFSVWCREDGTGIVACYSVSVPF